MKDITTFADYMADETRVPTVEKQKINFEVELIGKMIEVREKKGLSMVKNMLDFFWQSG